jgi:hypothetical protein
MSNKYTREKIKISPSLNPAKRIELATAVIEHIISRSAAGLDKKNNKFKPYTEKYAETKGVGTGDVDLILTGEMLDSLELVSHKSGEIVIGYKDPSDELAGKVEGNRIGSYGGEPSKKRARDFLGIPSDELALFEDLISDVENEDDGGFDVGSILDQILTDKFEG